MIESSISPEDMARMLHYAMQLPRGAVIVEIGTCDGGGAIELALGSPESSRVWTIDCGEAQIYGFGELYRAPFADKAKMVSRLARTQKSYERRLKRNFREAGCADKITFLFGSSHPHEQLPTVPWPADRLIDLLLVDGDHYYPSVMADMLRWMPKVKSGGYAMFHDYDGWDVKRAVGHYFEAYPIWQELERSKTMLYCQKGS